MCLVMQYVPTKTGYFPGDMPQCSIFQLKAVLTVPDGRAFCFCNGPKHTLKVQLSMQEMFSRHTQLSGKIFQG